MAPPAARSYESAVRDTYHPAVPRLQESRDGGRASGKPPSDTLQAQMSDEPDSDALVDAARAGDASAFRALYEHFAPQIYRFALFRLRRAADAEDLTQRVFVKVIEALPRYEHRGLPFRAWLFRIARNAVIDVQRVTRPAEPMELLESQASDGPGPV